jgi:hypothetical protein
MLMRILGQNASNRGAGMFRGGEVLRVGHIPAACCSSCTASLCMQSQGQHTVFLCASRPSSTGTQQTWPGGQHMSA